ncbi:uncharacterized protein LOC141692187 [Apium graveolens]|uniref:uncharacterized protein LOC141692184 n=1 Tax=Apium graveolens TaxID=4045 RepID=UPI003D7AEC57
MASPSLLKLKPLQSSHVFSLKSPSSFATNTTTSSTKFKTLAHTFILSHISRVVRALTKAKIILIGVLKDIQLLYLTEFTTKKHKNRNKIFFGSFRMHYNWCSSPVLPVASPQQNESSVSHSYYDATWNSIISPGCHEMEESQLSGYLHWLEKKVNEDSKKTNDMNEIDKLADMFIANCHEKFKLEKQESYRMFQEMMARSV